ncbi:alpha-1,2 glucosyltransferas-like protein alg10 [Polyplosphaeria fusca]|uniref:Dol-P-Glc:Glc(2)Man(9)GlcNAc(2)-PP-Dol alpha-1,2-glucosyltransferase n=1 Tax=Polyplosphaeria fusca TaxID=682080 RepID=A0A9P4V5J4_9PLEO|nr:alpha-1,2 glucosyltransferas-like protein alg10 [Polyplosphaeria fusca]
MAQMPSHIEKWALPIAVIVIASFAGAWHKLVDEQVPAPYLDEVFHVPQAQRYCNGDWSWDPKITTPPGLYLISLFIHYLGGSCDTSTLRALNAGAICLICLVAFNILQTTGARHSASQVEQGNAESDSRRIIRGNYKTLLDAHTAVNVGLFPPLFFFSGLYYTDVLSTLFILWTYDVFLKQTKTTWRFRDDIIYVVIGLAALAFRQTNIFWVAVYPAGLALVDALKSSDRIHDCAVGDASLYDCISSIVSIVTAAISNPAMVARTVGRYVVLLGFFTGFVAWNGGVVLGDKSNHVATIHLPQMLYLWPYIVFFSLPLTAVTLLGPAARFLPAGKFKSTCQERLAGLGAKARPDILTSIIFLALSVAAVHFNTIVHPFTLADNRHYVFYVFRILRRHPAIKYLAVPIYYLCFWQTIQTLGTAFGGNENMKRKTRATDGGRPITKSTARQPSQLSFAVVWIATTALSIVSAPLVEPRYFIIPWIMWRLHVPSLAALPSSTPPSAMASYDTRLILETAWLLFINGLTGYAFLYRGFAWPSEPGLVQRFLW